ncbi:hypothetical protein Mro03_81420 [Microbispora rosea subsp. rosea]|nr:hypothetical protein Mro03_81420 [Microbispora rosea subsp. rosea]
MSIRKRTLSCYFIEAYFPELRIAPALSRAWLEVSRRTSPAGCPGTISEDMSHRRAGM